MKDPSLDLSQFTSGKIELSLIFAILKYTVPSKGYNSTEQAAFPLDYNTKVLQDGTESYSRRDVTPVMLK